MERPGEPGRIVTGSRLLGFDLAVLALGWFHRPLLLSPTPDSDPTGRLLTRLQTEAGHRVADTEAWHDSAREHLARGEWLALAADASLRDEDTGTSDALHETFQLSGDTGALIVPVVVRSLGEGHHRLVVAEPFSHQETSPNQLTERLADLGKSSAG